MADLFVALAPLRWAACTRKRRRCSSPVCSALGEFGGRRDRRHPPGRGAAYAALDLDWLGWFGAADEAAHQRVLLKNLVAVVGNYRAAGVRLFILADAVPDAAQLADLKAALRMPVKVARLTVSLPEITRRLRSDVTTGRRDDLRAAAAWLATSRGAGIEDLTVPNDRPIRDVAAGVLNWLGWMRPR